MYIHLALSIAAPICILYRGRWERFTGGLFFFYLVMILVVHVTGWVCVGMAICAYRAGRYSHPDPDLYHLLHDLPERMCGDLLYPISAEKERRPEIVFISS